MTDTSALPISPERRAAVSVMTAVACVAAECHAKAIEIQSMRETDPHLIANITPESILAAMSAMLDGRVMSIAAEYDIPVATAVYALREAYKALPPDPAGATAYCEAIIAERDGARAPVRPPAPDLSKLI